MKKFNDWRRKALERGEEPENYCRDCSFAFQQAMIRDHRCRHPEVVFVEVPNDDGEPEIVGVRPDAEE